MTGGSLLPSSSTLEATPADTSACPPAGLMSGLSCSWSPGSSPSPCTSWSSASGCHGWRTRPSTPREGTSSAFSSTISSSGRNVPYHIYCLFFFFNASLHMKTELWKLLSYVPWLCYARPVFAEFGNASGDLT